MPAFDRNALESLDQIATSAESLRSSLDMQKEIRAVILDTNFLLSNLQYLRHLGQCVDACSDPNSFKIVIPWMVVQELDRIKVVINEGRLYVMKWACYSKTKLSGATRHGSGAGNARITILGGQVTEAKTMAARTKDDRTSWSRIL